MEKIWAFCAISVMFVCASLSDDILANDLKHLASSPALSADLPVNQNGASCASPLNPQKSSAGRRVNERISVLSELEFTDGKSELHVPGASFVKIHFAEFRLPPWVTVEVSNPDRTERYVYQAGKRGRHTRNKREGDDGKYRFSAMSITGDTAVVRVSGARQLGRSLRKYRLDIDYYVAGYPREDNNGSQSIQSLNLQSTGKVIKSKTETICGSNDFDDAPCYEFILQEKYDASRAVAKLLIDNGRNACTGWRVGSGNHLFTNEHCIANQAELEASEVWFDYELEFCGAETTKPPVKVTGAELLAVDHVLDFALFTVNDFQAILEFGNLGLEIDDPQMGELIYVPQHAYGLPRTISVDSDLNLSGQCEIDNANRDGRGERTDLGYYCDTAAGSSGSPVLLTDTNKVIALHHYGGCLNAGVKMSLIWPEVAEFFGGVVPGTGDEEPPQNLSPEAVVHAGCEGLTCNLDATASTDADGDIIGYLWDFGDGSVANEPVVTHEFGSPGDYQISLLVEDDVGATGVATTMVSVAAHNKPPSAAFQVACEETSCSFDAGLSTDADGQVVQYAWNFGDGDTLQTGFALAAHSFAGAGDYPVKLTVTDDDGDSATAQSVVTVKVTTPPPTVVTSSASSISDTGARLYGTANPNGASTTARFQWGTSAAYGSVSTGTDVGSGTAARSYGYILGALACGTTYHFRAVAENSGGTAYGSGRSFTTSACSTPPNNPPVAEFTYGCEELACSFDASASADADGQVVQYAWDFGDGHTLQTPAAGASHTFTAEGTYKVTLEVVDNEGSNDAISQAVDVTENIVNEPTIELLVNSGKFRGDKRVMLSWTTDSRADWLDVYRDDDLMLQTENDGEFVDLDIPPRTKEVSYRICEQDSTVVCSQKVSATF